MRAGLEAALCGVGDRLLRPLYRRRARPGLVVLVFHSITDEPRCKIDVTPDLLRRTIAAARAGGARIVALDEGLRALERGAVAESLVTLSFDDGYEDFLAVAAPILADAEAPATVSIVARHVDSGEPFTFASGQGRRSLTWDELGTLLDRHGDLITVANHSLDHRDFSRLSLAEIRRDVETSQAMIARRLGRAPRYFTYPYGAASEPGHAWLASRFDAVLGGVAGVNASARDIAALKRIPILAFDRPPTLALKTRGAPSTYTLARRLWR